MRLDGPATGPAAKAPFRTTELDEGQRAAQMGADPERLIDGEDPETRLHHESAPSSTRRLRQKASRRSNFRNSASIAIMSV